MLNQITTSLEAMHQAVNQMRSAKKQLKNYRELLKDNAKAKALIDTAEVLEKKITSWEEKLIQPKQKTFQDVINFHNQLNADFMHLKGFIDVAEPQVTEGAKDRLRDLLGQWNAFEKEKRAIVENDMTAFTQMYIALKLPAIILNQE